jgi:preprotein translocase subunit SecD
VRRSIIILTLTVVIIVGWFAATMASDNRPVLGLDLQGGTSIVLKPVAGSDTNALDAAVSIIRNRVDGLGIAEPDVSRQGDNIVVDLPGVKNAAQAQALVGKTAELRFRRVLDECAAPSSSNSSTTTTPKVSGSTTTVKGATTTTGATTSTTTQSATSTTKGKALAGRTIDTQPIAATTSVPATAATTAPTATTVPRATTPTTVANTADGCVGGVCKHTTPPPGQRDAQVTLLDNHNTTCFFLDKTIMTGTAVGSAQAVVDSQNGGWQVNVTFKNDDFINKIAKPYVNQNVAIELDGVVESAPKINSGITGHNVTISGSFSDKEAHNLALVLKYGSLPVQFVPQTATSVSPSLGKDQLKAGIAAGLIGLALVALYMIFFYRLLGLVVWVGIGLTGLTFFSLTTYLSTSHGLTLTLAGVTGIIVSVGVTVDSYVVYFERLKDEVRTGKTVRSSLDPGFRRAFRTIIAADLVSLIGAIVLYELATGSVRGFAFFLGISTLLDLILAYTFMYPCVSVLARRPSLVRMPGFGIATGLDVPEVRA